MFRGLRKLENWEHIVSYCKSPTINHMKERPPGQYISDLSKPNSTLYYLWQKWSRRSIQPMANTVLLFLMQCFISDFPKSMLRFYALSSQKQIKRDEPSKGRILSIFCALENVCLQFAITTSMKIYSASQSFWKNL